MILTLRCRNAIGRREGGFAVPVEHVNSNRALAGDTVYGSRKQRLKLKRQFLHAHELAFDHPATGERLEFVCELPVGLRTVMEKLRLVSGSGRKQLA